MEELEALNYVKDSKFFKFLGYNVMLNQGLAK